MSNTPNTPSAPAGSARNSARRPAARRLAPWIALAVLVAAVGVFLRLQRAPTRRADQPAVRVAAPDDVALAHARTHAERGEFEAALDQADRAIELNPDRIDAWLLRSEFLFRLHRSDEMVPALLRAIELDPERFEAHANLAYALRYVGRLDDAEREALWCLARNPRHVPVRRVLAEVRRDQGDIDAALREVRLALEHDPQDLDARLLEADLLIFLREFESAWSRLAPLLSQHPDNPRFLTALARAAQMSGRPDEAARLRAESQKFVDPTLVP